MNENLIHSSVQKIRQFNRFYTQFTGLLNEKINRSDYSLIEARVLFELGVHDQVSPGELNDSLKLDKGYLSRIISRFEKQKLIRKTPSRKDGRQVIISLSEQGKNIFADLNKRSNQQLTDILGQLSLEQIRELTYSINKIETILKSDKPKTANFLIRSHQPGDIGYLIYLHGSIYAREYGFDGSFDIYVAQGLCQFLEQYNPAKERLWIVEMEEQIIGSVAIVKAEEQVAQLRWLILDAKARGNKIGKKLVQEAVTFSKTKGYKKLILWTVTQLDQARKLYKDFGFQIVDSKSHHIWGQNLTEELWELVFLKN